MVTGKLPNYLLEDLVFKHIKHKRKDIITGAAVGEDNALIAFNDEVAVLSTDPITGAKHNIGSLAIDISCNDIATSGARPLGILITILAPPETTHDDIELIMKDAGEAAAKLDVEIMGGHTEITDAVNKIVISTTAVGKIKRKNLQKADKIKVGDKVLMTKSAGLEGTAILLKDLANFFSGEMSKENIEKGQDYSNRISVVKEGEIGGDVGVNYMHDVTEGGLLGAIWEAHKAVGKGIRIKEAMIPISDITREMCKILDIDPLRLISSGSMIIIANDEQYKSLKNKLQEADINISIIGEVIEEGIYIERAQGLETIGAPEADELYRALSKFDKD